MKRAKTWKKMKSCISSRIPDKENRKNKRQAVREELLIKVH